MPPRLLPSSRRRAAIALCGPLAAIALCFAWACADAVRAAPKHPLDPLAADELIAIRDVLAESGRFSPDTKFAWIALEEPPKARIESYVPGRAFARRARLTALDFGRGKNFAVTVDVGARRLDAVEDLDALQPGLTDYDLDRARKILDSEPRIKKALVRHGLQVPGAVSQSVRELFLGVGEDPTLSAEPGRPGRLVRALFISDQDAINDFGPLLDSVMAVVDVYAGRVVRLYDVPGLPISKAPHDVFDAKLRGTESAKMLRPVRAQGANFAVEGNEISWANWRLRLGFNVREGLVLHQVRFHDENKERSILHRASVSEVMSRYGDPSRAWPAIEFLDEGNFGLGELSAPVKPGREVPANAVTLSPLLPDAEARNFGRVRHDRIYIYERDAGLLMYYRQGGATVQARASDLVIGFLTSAGNYTYGLNWVFRQDGSFAFEAELAGEILTKPVGTHTCQACKPASPSAPAAADEERGTPEDFHGTLVDPQVVGVGHQHWFNLRLDFDVDGPNNAVMENEVARIAPSRDGQTSAFTVRHRRLETARDAKRDVEDAAARSWTIYNPSVLGPTGRPSGYTLVPVENAATIFPRSRERGPAGFTFHHLWVTPHRDGELFAGGRYPNQPPRDYADTLYHYAGDHSIYDRDIVVWYSLGETHVVRPEDYPLMSNVKLSVRFVPDGFFARNPALGRAIEEGKSQ